MASWLTAEILPSQVKTAEQCDQQGAPRCAPLHPPAPDPHPGPAAGAPHSSTPLCGTRSSPLARCSCLAPAASVATCAGAGGSSGPVRAHRALPTFRAQGKLPGCLPTQASTDYLVCHKPCPRSAQAAPPPRWTPSGSQVLCQSHGRSQGSGQPGNTCTHLQPGWTLPLRKQAGVRTSWREQRELLCHSISKAGLTPGDTVGINKIPMFGTLGVWVHWGLPWAGRS